MLIHRSCSPCTVKRLLIVNSIFNLVTVMSWFWLNGWLADCIEMLLRMWSGRYLIVVRSIAICAAPLLFPMNFFFLFRVNSTRALSRVYVAQCVHAANILTSLPSANRATGNDFMFQSYMLKANNSFDTIIINNFFHLPLLPILFIHHSALTLFNWSQIY